MFATFTGTKSGITLLIFALEQKLKVHWNGLQKTFLLSYYTSKSEQAENSLVLPKPCGRKIFLTDLEIVTLDSTFRSPNIMVRTLGIYKSEISKYIFENIHYSLVLTKEINSSIKKCQQTTWLRPLTSCITGKKTTIQLFQ